MLQAGGSQVRNLHRPLMKSGGFVKGASGDCYIVPHQTQIMLGIATTHPSQSLEDRCRCSATVPSPYLPRGTQCRAELMPQPIAFSTERVSSGTPRICATCDLAVGVRSSAAITATISWPSLDQAHAGRANNKAPNRSRCRTEIEAAAIAFSTKVVGMGVNILGCRIAGRSIRPTW